MNLHCGIFSNRNNESSSYSKNGSSMKHSESPPSMQPTNFSIVLRGFFFFLILLLFLFVFLIVRPCHRIFLEKFWASLMLCFWDLSFMLEILLKHHIIFVPRFKFKYNRLRSQLEELYIWTQCINYWDPL